MTTDPNAILMELREARRFRDNLLRVTEQELSEAKIKDPLASLFHQPSWHAYERAALNLSALRNHYEV